MNQGAPHRSRGDRRVWAPYCLLAVMLFLTVLAASSASKIAREKGRTEFTAEVEQMRQAAQQQIDDCLVGLSGLGALTTESVVLTRPQFRAYVGSLDLPRNHPGVRNMGFGHYLRASDKEKEAERMRAHGELIWPDSDSPVSCPITFFATAKGGPAPVMGFDLYSDPIIRSAMDQARDSGEAVCTAPLAPDHGERQLMIVKPVYPGTKKPETSGERQRALYGFHYCTISPADFFRALVEPGGNTINRTVYDGAEPEAAHLVFTSAATGGASAPPPLTSRCTLGLAGRIFTVVCTKPMPKGGAPGGLLLSGSAVSLLCFGLARTRIKGRRARELQAEALRSTGARFQRLVEQSIVGIYAVQDGRFSYVNPKMTEIFGYSEEELTSRPLSDFIAPESQAMVKTQIQRRMKGSVESIRYGLRAVRKDGQFLDLEAHGGRIENDGCTAILGCLIDVTEIKATEKRLSAFAALGQRLGAARNAVEAAEIVSQIADQLLGWDSCTLDIHSAEHDRLLRVHHIDRTDRGTQIMEECADRPKGSPARTELASPDRRLETRSQAPQSILSAPVRDGSSVIGLLTIQKAAAGAYDQHHLETLQALADHCGGALNRLRSEEAHARLSKEMQSLLESTGEGFYGLDAEGRCTFINEAAAQLLGFASGELRGQNMHELTHRHPHDGGIYALDKCPVCRPLKTGQPGRLDDAVFWRPNGGGLAVDYSSYPIVEEGSIRGAVVTFSDITERKRIEGEILELNATLERRVAERTLALEVSNKELESFSYSVSHDLRAPLRGIAGFALALSQGWDDKLDDKGREYLKRVLAAADRMSELIDDLLNLSRVTRTEMHRRTVDLSAAARTVIEDLQRSAPERAVEIVIAEKAPVEGDDRLLRIVLENLLGNAWKFTAQKEGARIEFGAFMDSAGNRICFVRDNGAGFDMAYADKLFGVFQRLHGANEFPGTGVGLATVQRIIQRHGGRIWAEAAPNEGATFYFTVSP